MNAEIISIGTEILLGEINDTNSTWIARQLRDSGINLFYITAIGDNQQRIEDGIRRGLDRSDLVITTGGLGPTRDDVTRQAVAAATDRELEFQQDLLDEIARRFEQYGVIMTENNRQQAFVPQGAIIINNPVGSAPCYIVESDQGIVLSLPGVPREMKYLMEHEILPYLRQKMGLPAIIKARILRTAGIGESSLDDKIGHLMDDANPTVGLAAHSGQTDIRITARADTEAEADTLIAAVEAKIRAEVDAYIFGVDSEQLDDVMPDLLGQLGYRMVLIEAGLDGILSQSAKIGTPENTLFLNSSIYQDVSAFKAAHPSAATLKDLLDTVLTAYRDELDAELGLAIIYDPDSGESAYVVQTPSYSGGRQLKLGDSTQVAKWGYQWGLGAIWRSLNKELDEQNT